MYLNLGRLGQSDETTYEGDIIDEGQSGGVLPNTETAPTVMVSDNQGIQISPVTAAPTLAPTVMVSDLQPLQIPSVASTPAIAPVSASSPGGVQAVTLPNGVSINPAALTAAQKAMTPAQLQAQLYPGTVATAPAPAASSVPFNLQAWLTKSTIFSGISNQAVALGGLLFAGALTFIMAKKKKR